ncbi:hypothetical protein COY27_02160 [Candidatus Woesearchaeota archaeon CG_4_10_14_0_2_um_filter_33_13]|nr:MAG: hypothetical protein COY27_02160 [Candidatus Woesearchaeota archaeon CG_4_10_14_0_2_um_filter_33_13]
MLINSKISEIAGIVLGDGHIHTKHNLITITGSIEDLDYYQNHVCKIINTKFNVNPKIKRRNDRNSYYIMIYSKGLINYLTNKMGLKRGSKDTAEVPQIISSNKKLIPYFLRGLFDTDGCIKFSKQGSNLNYYPRVQIALKKSPLAYQLAELFKTLNFNYGTWEENRFNGIVYYQISGKENLEKWFKEISPKNQVHLTKHLFWKKFGYCPPKSTLKFRKSRLLLQEPKRKVKKV